MGFVSKTLKIMIMIIKKKGKMVDDEAHPKIARSKEV